MSSGIANFNNDISITYDCLTYIISIIGEGGNWGDYYVSNNI